MLLHLIYAAIVAVIVAWAMMAIELSVAGYDVKASSIKHLGGKGLLFTVCGGLLVGGLFYFLKRITFKTRMWAIVIGVVLILLCLFVVWWAKIEEQTLLHCVLFVVLIATLCYVMGRAAGIIVQSGIPKTAFLTGLVRILPWLFFIWPSWFFVMHFLERHHENDNHDEAEEECYCGALQVIATIAAIAATVILARSFFKVPAEARNMPPAESTTEAATTVAAATTLSKEEQDKKADDAVRGIIPVPAEVDKEDVASFYAKRLSEKLMTNTWPTEARNRKDDSAFLLNGKGLYGAVEYPVDVALARAAGYRIDHEGYYSEDELGSIQYWIEERLRSGKLSDFERAMIIDWIVERIARDPIYGHMWAQALAELHSQSGKSVREMYPWLDKFLNDWENGKRLEFYAARYSNRDGLYVHPDYKPIAYAIATAIERLTVAMVDTPTAYHFRMEDLPDLPSKVTTVKASDMESLAAAVLAAYDKNGEVFMERLGLNLFDGRAEVIPQPKKVESTIPASTKPAPTTPASTTPASTTPAPTTPAPTCPPTTPAPTTPAPTTPVPTTPVPTTPVPTTPVPTTPVPTTPVPTTPVPTTPVPTTPVPTTPVPTTPAPTEPPTEPPTTPQYTKDPSKGINPTEEEKVRPNDDKGPGPNTNPTDPAADPSKSAKDNENNSPSYPSYDDYKKEMEEKKKTNESQKTGKDDNTPTPTTAAPTTVAPTTAKPTTPATTAPTTTVNVDNNGDTGNGGAPINDKTPTEPKGNYTDPASPTTGPISEETRAPWGGPPD